MLIYQLKNLEQIKIHIERAQHLFNIGRYDNALSELKQALALDPNNPDVLEMLAMSYYNSRDFDRSLEASKMLLGAAPSYSFAHYLVGLAQNALNKTKEAEEHFKEAIRLDPSVSTYYGALASLLIQKKEFEAALYLTERGLALDPENEDCLNARTMSLTKLGRKDDMKNAAYDTMQANPNSAFSHANVGWAKLEAGDHQGAKHHFAEALRLNPTLEHARTGMLEALKAKNPFYRYFLYWVFWMSNKTSQNQWIMIAGVFLLQQVLGHYAEQFPALNYVLYGVIFLVYMTWITDSLFNLALYLDPVARHALTDDERKAAWVAGLGLLTILGSIGAFIVTNIGFFTALAIVTAGILIPATKYFTIERPDLKQKVGWYAVGMSVIGALLLLTGSSGMLNLFALGFIGFQILYNVWAMSSRGLV
jgi:tetratricopeptide (TPR) repeat protein